MMLAEFETATHGDIRLGGSPINTIPPYKRGFGMVFQNYALFPHMTIVENLFFPLVVRKMGKSEREEKGMRTLDMVQMAASNSLRGQTSFMKNLRTASLRNILLKTIRWTSLFRK